MYKMDMKEFNNLKEGDELKLSDSPLFPPITNNRTVLVVQVNRKLDVHIGYYVHSVEVEWYEDTYRGIDIIPYYLAGECTKINKEVSLKGV